MALGIAGLITAYVLIALLLLSLNLYSNWSWKVKAGTIVIVTVFYIVSYLSYPPLLGWPTTEQPPERFKLLAAHVEQPDKAAGTEGSIYLWVTQIDDLTAYGPPRAYKLPYSDLMHEVVIKANAKLKRDMPQLGELNEEGAMKAQVKDSSRAGASNAPIVFYDLPDPLFPEK